MAIVIQSACEQLVWFQAIKNGFIYQNERGFLIFITMPEEPQQRWNV